MSVPASANAALVVDFAMHVVPPVSAPLTPSNRVRTGFAVAEDGTRLYWRAVGQGPAMVCCNGVGVSIFFWKYLVEHYCRTHTVILWDYRAHGRSDRPADIATADLSIPRHARDLAVVMDAAGISDALLLGHSMGVQVILEFHRNHPERVRGLVPLLGTAGRALESFYDYAGSPRLFRAASRFLDSMGDRSHFVIRPIMESPLAWWVARKASLVDPLYCRKEDLLPYMRHLASLDIRVFLHTVLLTQEHDAWDTLAGIKVPTLVIAAERDTFTPMWLSRKMVATIPGAELLVLAEGSHAALIEQPDTIHHRIDRFLLERGVFPPGS
jgi:pimeloyl-ACP methyl ester carboxylesterase